MKFINWVKFKITKNRIDRRIVLQSATISSFVFVIIIYNLFSAAYKSEESKIINKYNNFGSDLLNVFQHNIRPVLDLHLFCDDGRHIGLNYETGQFENQIPGSQVSGPASGAPEWIYIPASTTATCRYEVSAIKNKKFLDENPELKAKDIDKSDSYDIYARYIDPESGIFTSKKVEKQRIQPGEELEHTATGKLDIEISSGKKKESNKPKTNNVVL